jgi:hypothetical protein
VLKNQAKLGVSRFSCCYIIKIRKTPLAARLCEPLKITSKCRNIENDCMSKTGIQDPFEAPFLSPEKARGGLSKIYPLKHAVEARMRPER